MSADWLPLQRHYEACLERSGASPAGVDWPDPADLVTRFETQLAVLPAAPAGGEPPELLDLGCGPGLLLDYLAATNRLETVRYRGIDLSPAMIAAAQARWPDACFEARDILQHPLTPQSVDAVVMNGVLTERRSIPRPHMVGLAQALVRAAFAAARHGVAFNAMSRHVDWERDDLFHWGFDEVAAFLTRDVTRHLSFRADYGLHEFTAFAWRTPQRTPVSLADGWWEH